MITTSLKNRTGMIAATVVISCVLCVMLAGCATQNSGNVTSDQDEYSAVEEATITTRTVTFPAAFFEDESPEDVQSSLQEKGCTDITANDDGSYTATMSIDSYNSFVDSWHQNVVDAFDGMPNSEDWPTITAIDYDCLHVPAICGSAGQLRCEYRRPKRRGARERHLPGCA